MEMEKVVRSRTLTEQVTEAIRSAILSGELAPGRVYSTSALGKQLGVSRTPTREALLELERRGLVTIEKNRGARIRSTSIDTLVEVFQVRLMLELPLVRRSVERQTPATLQALEEAYEAFHEAAQANDPEATLKADRDFHVALLAGADNQRASQILREQRDFVLTTGVGTVPLSRTPMECFTDHVKIMEYFRAKKTEELVAELGRHISETAFMLIRQEAGSASAHGNIHEVFGWAMM